MTVNLQDISFLDESGDLDSGKLEQEFIALYRIDPLLPALIASRCALRIFPFYRETMDLTAG